MEPTEFTATVEDATDEARIRCTGDLNGRADAALEAAYAAASALGHDKITLDFERCGYINSTGIALIVRFLSDARADGRTVRAAGLTPHYKQIFEITRLSDYMEILDAAPTGAASTSDGDGA
jgi:anti-sigma B factor antagonist